MLTMSAPKKQRHMGRPRKHSGEADGQGRTGVPVSLRLDPELMALLSQFVIEYRQRTDVKLSKTDVIELALTKLYREFGILPAQSQPSKKA